MHCMSDELTEAGLMLKAARARLRCIVLGKDWL
jgi:hypothetical protein